MNVCLLECFDLNWCKIREVCLTNDVCGFFQLLRLFVQRHTVRKKREQKVNISCIWSLPLEYECLLIINFDNSPFASFNHCTQTLIFRGLQNDMKFFEDTLCRWHHHRLQFRTPTECRFCYIFVCSRFYFWQLFCLGIAPFKLFLLRCQTK